jgi:hypothetical protein
MSEIVVVITGATGPSGGGGGGGASTLDDLTDVTITAAAAGDILRYSGSAWVDAVGTTHFEAAGGIATHAAVTSSVHGISAFGATLVDDADAATARTTLGLAIGTNVQAYDADLADIAALTRTKGDLIVATSSAWTDLAVGTDGDVLTADSAQSTGVKWAAASGGASADFNQVTTGQTRWHGPPHMGTPAGTAFPILSRAYYTPFMFPTSVTISAVAFNVTSAGNTGNVFRYGIFTMANGVPTTILDQGTAASDSTGIKTVALGSPITVSGPIFIALVAQGTSTPGSTWMSAIQGGIMPTADNGASWGNTNISGWSMYTDSITGAFSSSPSVTIESNARNPYIAVRLT